MSAVIEISNLTRRYGRRRGVDDVTLSIGAGTLYGFLGPNGAGKTTTIRVLLGFLRASSGRATVLGLDCWRDSARVKREVGAIPGDLRLWPYLNGHSALALFGSVRGKDLRAAGLALADELELDLRVPVRKMSRGMRQKLGLILALAHDPQVLILDEPTTALDPLMQDRLREILRRKARAGRTVFFSSHTLSEVEDLCERVAIVRQGRIVADSTLEELRRQASHEVQVHWRERAPETVPEFLTLDVRTAREWRGRLRGEIGVLLAYLGAHPGVEDVRIARPDLEDIFRRYYEDEAGVAGAAAPDVAEARS
ncbi:MAG: ABC transporter ATP-binding protein [Planctomycetota bacterium]|nr:ABC transporter ATP-binding protein [Planctomycetota bacterium]